MKMQKMLFLVSFMFLLVSSATVAIAGDFSWMRNLNIQAEADPEGFKARLRARFKVGDTEIKAVLRDVTNPADAYMVFRYGEMASRSTNQVMEKYREKKKKGWGVLAKNLGIKPGSQEFHTLKRNHDMSDVSKNNKIKLKDKGKGKSKKKNKGKS